ALATRRKDGSLAIVLWNYAPPEARGTDRTFALQFKGMQAHAVRISQVDPSHGDYHQTYEKMGSPRYPTSSQIQQLINASVLPPAEERPLNSGQLTVTLPSYGLALIEVR